MSRFFPAIVVVAACSCIHEDTEQPTEEGLDAMAELELDEENSSQLEIVEVSNHSLRADFNGDGKADLAIGAPNQEFNGRASGGVTILYGSADGLTSTGSQVWHQGTGTGTTGVGVPEAGDEFGVALAAGNFNGDQYADLAIGAPSDDVDARNAGSVTILHGSAHGLTSPGQLWNQGTGIGDMPEPNDNFGSTLTTGYFNDDEYADLAIGVYGENIGMTVDAGVVHVIYGSSEGLTGAGNQLLYQELVGVAENVEDGDRFGAALVTGDFDHDEHDDLAIGVPGEDLDKPKDAGLVHVLYGSDGGLWPNGSSIDPPVAPQIWQQDSPGIEGVGQASDEFGRALAVGDFDHDGVDDLAVGAPGESVSFMDAAGAVHAIYGSADVGLTEAGNQVWHQNSSGVRGEVDAGDNFGETLAVGDFDGDACDDLAIGSPGENLGSIVDAGMVHVLYGTGSGLSSTGDQWWHRNASGIEGAAASFDLFGSSLSIGDFDGNGAADLAIGVPPDDVGATDEPGLVNVIYGHDDDGLTGNGDQVWRSGHPKALEVAAR
jgi:hypothetical protein